MPSSPVDLAHKFIALACNNTDETEAMFAAMRAVRIIAHHSLSLGGNTVQATVKDWTPSDEDYEDILRVTKAAEEATEAEYGGEYTGNKKTGIKLSIQDTDVEDDPWRKRINLLLRGIRRERAKLDAAIHAWSIGKGVRFYRGQDVCPICGRKDV